MAFQLENLRGLGKGLNSAALRLGVRSLHGPPKANEYVETAVYPKISPFKNQEEKNLFKTKEAVKSLKTVEEKMYQINRPKKFGWYSYIVNTEYISSDILDWAKFSTCTKVIDGLPSQLAYDKENDKKVDEVISQIGKDIELAVRNLDHLEYYKDVTNDKILYSEMNATGKGSYSEVEKEIMRSDYIIKRVHDLIQTNLCHTEPHILNSVEMAMPRVEGFWFRGGIKPDKSMIKKRQGLQDMMKKKMRATLTERDREVWEEKLAQRDEAYVNKTYERCIQVKADTVLHMRHADPLNEFVDRDDKLCTEIDIPIVDFDPRSYEFKTKCQHGTNIPGCWPQDNNRMGLLAYHNRVNRRRDNIFFFDKPPSEQTARNEDLSKGILTNFAWTLGQAVQLGFSPLNELTFPLVSQTVNSDGRLWSFFAYQMNTCDLSSNDHSSRTHQNLLWAHPTVQLYDKIEDGKLVNFDPDCLRPLIKMYLNKPEERGYLTTPYLDPHMPLVTDHPDPYQRKRFLDIIRAQMANKPQEGHNQKPEIYMWEKIKLIDHKAMPPQFRLAARRRWWHMQRTDFMGKEHWNPEFVNCDEKTHRYIPKGKRPAWTRKGTLNRRYNKYDPKIQVPLKNKIAVWSVPDMKYRGDED